MKTVFLAIFLLLPAYSSMAKGNTHPAKKDKLEEQILAGVSALWEVKVFMHDHQASKPMLMIAREPYRSFKYYWVQLGISNFEMFRSSENFCVDPKTLKVYYWDVVADDTGFSDSAIISVAQWRALRKTANWQKRHTYKRGKLVVLAD
jgi:hypothetical protein